MTYQTKDLLDRLKALGHPPRFHGNGFTQLYLSPTRRLHVWASQLPPIPNHNATIHDHVFDMKSIVLFGELEHVTYDFDRTFRKHDMYELSPPPPGAKAAPKSCVDIGYLIETGRYSMVERSDYSFPHRQLHESNPVSSHVVTVIDKITTPQMRNLRPRVVCPKGEKPVDAFDPAYAPDTEIMWDVITEGIQRIYSSDSGSTRIEFIESSLP